MLFYLCSFIVDVSTSDRRHEIKRADLPSLQLEQDPVAPRFIVIACVRLEVEDALPVCETPSGGLDVKLICNFVEEQPIFLMLRTARRKRRPEVLILLQELRQIPRKIRRLVT